MARAVAFSGGFAPLRKLRRGSQALAPAAAYAGEPSEADLKRARELFAQATKLETAESYTSALEKLKEVAAIKSTPAVLYHMANCEEQLGKLGDALLHFQQSNELAIQQNSSEVRGLAPGKVAALRDRAPRLAIEVTPRLDHTEILLDGVAVPSDKLQDVRVNPDQEYVLKIRAPGREPIEKTVRLKERGTEDLHIELKVTPAALPSGPEHDHPEPVAPSAHPQERSVLPLVLGGAASAVFLGVGIAMTFAANGKGSDSDALRAQVLSLSSNKDPEAGGQCVNPTGADLVRACDALSSSESSRLTFQGIAIGAYIGAGAALAGGAIWYFMQPRAPTSASSAIQATPVITTSSSSVVVSGRF